MKFANKMSMKNQQKKKVYEKHNETRCDDE